MIEHGEKVLVAFSGGCDSVCLALSLKNLGYEVGLAHVNHNLRESAINDAKFCEKFAKKLGVPFYISCPDVKGYAEQNKLSLETAGRILRYEFFESVKGYDKIATAHHKNDCAETVLQHLVRGSGLKGLTGILPVRDKFIRPLIDLTRSQVEDIVESFEECFCTDETNFSDEYSRNRIRLSVIPLLEKENEKAVDNIAKTASVLAADEEFLTSLAQKEISENKIEISRLEAMPYPIAYRVLRLLFENAAGTAKDFEARHAEYILSHLKQHGDIMDLPFSVVAASVYGNLEFHKKEECSGYCYKLATGENIFPELNLKITLESCDKMSGKSIVYADKEKLSGCNLYLRTPKAEDKFVPFGMTGGKKLSKTLIDLKIPRHERCSVPLIATENEILSIVMKKRSNAYCCSENTKEILLIREEKIHE